MALTHSYSWEFPLNSDQFNRVIAAQIAAGVYEGMLVTSSAMTMAVNVGPGRCLLPNGTTVWNDVTLINVAAAGTNGNSNPRIDVVVMEYVHGSDPDINKPRIKILAGDPAVIPTPAATNSNQLVLATIYLAPGASSISNSVITNVERIPQFNAGSLRYSHPDGTSDSISYNKTTDDFVSNIDLRTTTYLPGSMLLTAAKMAMEGIYAGNFTVEHTINSYGKPSSSVLTIEGLAPISIAYTYYPNQWLHTRVMLTSKHKLTETYSYQTPAGQPQNPLPNVEQEIEVIS